MRNIAFFFIFVVLQSDRSEILILRGNCIIFLESSNPSSYASTDRTDVIIDFERNGTFRLRSFSPFSPSNRRRKLQCKMERKIVGTLAEFNPADGIAAKSLGNRKMRILVAYACRASKRVFGLSWTVIRNNHGRWRHIGKSGKHRSQRFREIVSRFLRAVSLVFCSARKARAPANASRVKVCTRVINARSKLLMRQLDRTRFIRHFRHAPAFIRFAHAGGI